jgi:AcrR family transcriptional regulator
MGRPKVKPRGNDTAARILTAAARLFRTKGYDGTNTRELAAVLGIQKASLYYHMAKKEDLLFQLSVESLKHIRSDVETALTAHSAPLQRVRVLIESHLAAALADQDKHATMLMELRSLSTRRRAVVVKMRDSYEELIRAELELAQTAGAIRNDLPAKYLGLALMNLLNWSIFWFKPAGALTPSGLGRVLSSIFVEGVRADRSGAPVAPSLRPDRLLGTKRMRSRPGSSGNRTAKLSG